MNNDVSKIVQSVVDGIATEREQGLALRALQTSLAFHLVKDLDKLSKNVTALNDVLQSALEKFTCQFEAESGTMSSKDLLEIVEKIQNKQLQVMDLYRKVVQGRELFPDETMSDEEKTLKKLLASFKSVDEKQEFLRICEARLSRVEPEA